MTVQPVAERYRRHPHFNLIAEIWYRLCNFYYFHNKSSDDLSWESNVTNIILSFPITIEISNETIQDFLNLW